jgi:hypothetical protein
MDRQFWFKRYQDPGPLTADTGSRTLVPVENLEVTVPIPHDSRVQSVERSALGMESKTLPPQFHETCRPFMLSWRE